MRLVWCALLTTLLLPAASEAQLAPIGIPRGLLRFGIDGSFAYANERFNDGTRENLGANFTSPALGSDQIPTLAEADQRIAVLLNQPGYKLNLGASIGTAQVSSGTGAFSIGLGITRGLAIYGRLPIVSTWWRQGVSIDTATSTAGVNQADPVIGNTTGASVAESFFTEFNTSLAGLEQRIASGVVRWRSHAKGARHPDARLGHGPVGQPQRVDHQRRHGVAIPAVGLEQRRPDAEWAGHLGAAGPRRL